MLLANYLNNSFRLSWWAILLWLVFLVSLYSYTSSGISRGGEDDEGSGIGGTGRQLAPGSGSGLGGTGRRPFLGLSNDSEVQILQHGEPSARSVIDSLQLDLAVTKAVTLPPLPAPAAVTRESWLTEDSLAIDISEHIQYRLTETAMYFRPFEMEELRTNDSSISEPTQSENSRPNWLELSHYLAESSPEPSDSDRAVAETQTDSDTEAAKNEARTARPDRLHRPELPPIRRVGPVRRATILPPRIKPLRL